MIGDADAWCTAVWYMRYASVGYREMEQDARSCLLLSIHQVNKTDFQTSHGYGSAWYWYCLGTSLDNSTSR